MLLKFIKSNPTIVMTNKEIFSESVRLGMETGTPRDPIVAILSRPAVPKAVEFQNVNVFVVVKPATGSFARWAKKENVGFVPTEGGLFIPIKWGGDSVYSKLEFARAFSDNLKHHGISSHVQLKTIE